MLSRDGVSDMDEHLAMAAADDLSDMYLDDRSLDHHNMLTVRAMSSVESFRSAISHVEVQEGAGVKTSPLSSNAVTTVNNDTKDDPSSSYASSEELKSMDLLDNVEGMYRILDLVSEHGSGGLGESHLFCASALI